jgi:hypothetical protein
MGRGALTVCTGMLRCRCARRRDNRQRQRNMRLFFSGPRILGILAGSACGRRLSVRQSARRHQASAADHRRRNRRRYPVRRIVLAAGGYQWLKRRFNENY